MDTAAAEARLPIAGPPHDGQRSSLLNSKVELTFTSVPTLPLLELPKGSVTCVNGKYDYSVSADRPFSINLPDDSQQNDFQVNVEPDDFLNSTPEPETGIFPEEFDREKFEKVVNSISCTEYVPYTFRATVPPLRPPNQIAAVEKVQDIQAILSKKQSPDLATTYIKLVDNPLPAKVLKSLGKYISQYAKLNVLILRSIQLQKLDDFILPKLQYVDFSNNLIKTVKSCLSMFKHSPFLEVIKLQGNPLTAKVTYRPKLIGSCSLCLKALDDRKIEISERIDAIVQYGTKSNKQNIGYIRWDLSFAATPDVKAMSSWQPSKLVMLALPKQKLSYFNVGALVNLEYLDLSRNSIRETRGMGLEKCHALQHLNLKQNLIQKRESLRVLGFLPCLQYLMLKGNPVTQAPDYRLTVTFETRFLRGSNRTTGLVELDEVPITIDERIQALKMNKTSVDVEKWRWRYVLMQSFGHMQIKSSEIMAKIKILSFPKCKLTFVDLSAFPSVEYLDLSKNNLKEVAGLQLLRKLRLLNLADNGKLKWKATLVKLRGTTTLEMVNLCVTARDHPRQANNKKYRALVLKELSSNLDLFSVDDIPITPGERVETYRSMKGVTNEQAEHYRFRLAIVLEVTPATNRKYYPSSVAPGTQYDPLEVTSLFRLRGMGITFTDFKPFRNLEEINLSRNKLTDITNIGLDDLPRLKVLDVSFNNIGGTLKSLASFLDKLAMLECIGIRGNPVVKNFPEDRKKLISLMTSMKESRCQLQVIDIHISISERVEAWRKSSTAKKGLTLRRSTVLTPEKIAKFRMDAILFQRVPNNVAPTQLKTLDLRECALPSFDVTMFDNLETLLMRKNDIRTRDDVRGLTDLKNLRVLDLRDNCFEKLDDFVDLVNLLESLVSIGMRGNKCTSAKDYRSKFLAQIPQLHESRFHLYVIDNEPIGIDEICSVWKTPKDMSACDKFFHVLILRKTPDIPLAQVKELDLSLCGLTNMDLSKFTGLEKLSLRGNSIDAHSLIDSHVTQMQRLLALDITDNNICDFGALIAVAKALPRLEYFSCTGNPCFPNNEPLLRINLLAKLPCMKELNAPFKFLNGLEIMIEERCQALERDSSVDLENFRMDLLFEKMRINERDTRRVLQVQQLDIDHFELTSLRRLKPFANLAFLKASHNKLRTLEEDVLLSLPSLTYLDIQHNEIEDKGAKLLAIFSRMPALKALFIRKSTRDKTKTNKPKQYLKRVCSVVRQIEILDGLPNPFLAHGCSGSGIYAQAPLYTAGVPIPSLLPLSAMPPAMFASPPIGSHPLPYPGPPAPSGYLPHMQPNHGNNAYFTGAVQPNVPWSNGGMSPVEPQASAPPLQETPKVKSKMSHESGDEEEEILSKESCSSDSDSEEEESYNSEDDDADEEEPDEEETNEEESLPQDLCGLAGVSVSTLRIPKKNSRQAAADPWEEDKTLERSASLGHTPTLKKVERLSDSDDEDGSQPHDGDSDVGEEDGDLRDESTVPELHEDQTQPENNSGDGKEGEELRRDSEQSELEEVEHGRLWEPEEEISQVGDTDTESKSFKESMRQQVPTKAANRALLINGNSSQNGSENSTGSDGENEEPKDDEYWESEEEGNAEEPLPGISQASWPAPTTTLRRLASEISSDLLADYG